MNNLKMLQQKKIVKAGFVKKSKNNIKNKLNRFKIPQFVQEFEIKTLNPYSKKRL